jgi:large subunit ribosomal protein L25
VVDYVIEVEPRTIVGKKVKTLRAQGLVPITVYGGNTEPMSLQARYRELQVALMNAGGTNLITLKVDKESVIVLARDVQRDVLKGDILHADFLVIDQKARIQVDLPVEFVGESPAVAAREGILITGPNTIVVEMLPKYLAEIDSVTVDLTTLKNVGDAITIADLDLGEDITIIDDPEEMLARVSQTSAARAELLDNILAGEEEETQDAAGEVEIVGEDEAEEEFEEE